MEKLIGGSLKIIHQKIHQLDLSKKHQKYPS